MSGTRDIAGRRYALAVLEIARQDGNLDEWLASVGTLEQLTARAEFVNALHADGMTDERFTVIVEQVHPGMGRKQLNLFRLLRRKSRLALGPSIATFYQELLDDERKIGRATVTTAVALDEDRRSKIEQQLTEQTGKQIALEASVDEEMLGGMTVRIADRLYDASTRSRLRSLKRELERASR